MRRIYGISSFKVSASSLRFAELRMKRRYFEHVFIFVVLAWLIVVSPASAGRDAESLKFIIGEENLAPWATGLLQFGPASGPAKVENLGSKYQLVLAAKRTNRPDVLHQLRRYQDGWDITNKHYWASVGFTGAAGFVLGFLWFISFGIVLVVHRCCRWQINIKDKESRLPQRICLALLVLFTCAAAAGCILLSVGQDEFHGEVLHTLNFVVNQSDFTVQILRNVTEYLLVAKSIHVEGVVLPSNDEIEIDKLNVDLNETANVLTEKTDENSAKVRKALDAVFALIVVAAVMLLLALLGLLLSILGHQHAIYTFILSGWLLVAITFILCGIFAILSNTISDTCVAMDEWVDNPRAETALSNILPCVDERTTNHTLYQSKAVILKLVNLVNTAIYSIANADFPRSLAPFNYNQSGPLMPPLCPPFDNQLHDRQCQEPWELSFANASMVWEKYTCQVSPSGACISPGRITPEIYSQLVAAVNVSYALYHYAPLVLSLQDCNFVRDAFTTITTSYCPPLEHYLKIVNAGLALISVGVMLCLLLWIAYANRPQAREDVLA